MVIKAFKRLATYRQHLPVRWTAALAIAIVIAYADGFWLTALQGVIGAVERNEPPFFRWLRDATLMVPLVFVAVLIALLCVQRWFGHTKALLLRLSAAVVLLTLISGVVGITEAAASSLYDYRLQAQHVELMHSYGAKAKLGAVGLAGFGAAEPISYATYCSLRGTLIGGASGSAVAGNAVTRLEYASFTTHVRGLIAYTLLALISNLAIALVMVGLWRANLWVARSPAQPRISETTSVAAAGGMPI